MHGKIPLLVAQEENPSEDPGVGMLPSRPGKRSLSIMEVDGQELTTGLAEVVAQLHELANAVQQESEGYEIEHVDFSLGVSKNGKIGILSTIDLAKGVQATISIRLKRK